MDFHQTSAERFAEKIYNYIAEKFDGKVINSDECNVELMIKYMPFDINDDDINDDDTAAIEISNNNNSEEDTPVEEENDTVTDNNNEDELFTDNIIDTPSLGKKGKKKNKKKGKSVEDNPVEDNPVKKKRKPNKCLYFRTHPDNKQLIEEKNQEINPETGQIYNNKVKSGCVLWNSLSTDEQAVWGERCMADNTD